MARMRHGVHRPLEDEANRILGMQLTPITSHAAKADVLTPWKEMERRRREVYVTSGTPDPSVRRGMYWRSANTQSPHLNSREGVTPAMRMESTLASFVESHPDPWEGVSR